MTGVQTCALPIYQRSELGTILDPLADKLLLVSGVVVLSFDHAPQLGRIPLWLTGVIIGRDVLILIGLGVVYVTVGKVNVRPRFFGKIATVLQMVSILWLLLKWDSAFGGEWFRYIAISAAFTTGISGLLYVWDGARQLASSPKSLASGGPE